MDESMWGHYANPGKDYMKPFIITVLIVAIIWGAPWFMLVGLCKDVKEIKHMVNEVICTALELEG